VAAAYRSLFLATPFLPNGSVFNIASGKVRRIREVLNVLLALSGRTIVIEIDQARLRANEPPIARRRRSIARRC